MVTQKKHFHAGQTQTLYVSTKSILRITNHHYWSIGNRVEKVQRKIVRKIEEDLRQARIDSHMLRDREKIRIKEKNLQFEAWEGNKSDIMWTKQTNHEYSQKVTRI